MDTCDIQNFMKLNQATAIAISGATSGIADKLAQFEDNRELVDSQFTPMIVDPRKKPEDYFDEKVRSAVSKIFKIRADVERKMTREQLVAFDRDLQYRFTPENFRNTLLSEIGLDFARLNEFKAMTKDLAGNAHESQTTLLKKVNNNGQELSKMKNVDAIYKGLSRQYIMNRNHDFYQMYPHLKKQDHVYTYEFERQALKPPPEIDEYDYLPKTSYLAPEYRSIDQRQSTQATLDSKISQDELGSIYRREVYYILEQM